MKFNTLALINVFAAIFLMANNQSFGSIEGTEDRTSLSQEIHTLTIEEIDRLTEEILKFDTRLTGLLQKKELTIPESEKFIELYEHCLKLNSEQQKIQDSIYQKIADNTMHDTVRNDALASIGKSEKQYRECLDNRFGTLLATCKNRIAPASKKS